MPRAIDSRQIAPAADKDPLRSGTNWQDPQGAIGEAAQFWGNPLGVIFDGLRNLVQGFLDALANPLGFLEAVGAAITNALDALAVAFGIKSANDPIDDTGVAASLSTYQSTSEKGQPNGYAGLDSSGKVPTSQLPASASGVTSVNTRTGAVTLTKSDVGLANVENTSDADKPVSTATQTALSGKAAAVHTHVATDVSDSTSTGRAVLTAADAAAARTAIGAGTSSLTLGTTAGTAKAGDYQPASTNISDSTATGRALLTAADAAAAKTTLSLTKSDVGLGSVNNLASAATATASTLAQRDGNAHVVANQFTAPLTQTATAAGTTTLTVASSRAQLFTGTSTHTVVLPSTSVVAGTSYYVSNLSTGAVTVQAANAATVATLTSGMVGVFTARVNAPGSLSGWVGTVTYGGTTLTSKNSLTLGGTDGTEFTFPSSSDTVVTLGATQTLTAKTLTSPKITSGSVPATASATGTAGTIQWDANYIYVCTATNTWKRAALSTW